MSGKARILKHEETVKVFRSICPFSNGTQKPANQRWGLLSINSYGDEWVDAVLYNSSKHKTPIAIVSSPSGYKGWGAGSMVAGMMAAAARVRIFGEVTGKLDGVAFDDARIICGLDHQDAPKFWQDEKAGVKNPNYEQDCDKLLASAEALMKLPEVTFYMFDGAHLPDLKENMRFTKKLVEMGKKHGVLVEGELTATAGIEDGKEYTASMLQGKQVKDYVKRVCDFIEETGVGAIAFDIGSAHGKREGENIIRTDIVMEYSEEAHRRGLWVPLVLHGGTGVPDETVREYIGFIGKINKATIGKNIVMQGRYFFSSEHVRAILGLPGVSDKEIYKGTKPEDHYLAGALPWAKKIEEFVEVANCANKSVELGLL
jgi:fructose/tagatose bisphosphate aldolase